MKMFAFALNGSPIIGTSDTIPGTALIAEGSFVRGADGSLEFEWAGETDVCWDGQVTNERNGETLYVADDGQEWRESEVLLLKEEDVERWEFDENAKPKVE